MLSLTIRVCIRLFRLPVVASEICEIPRNSQKFNLQQLKQARKIICVHKQLKSLRRHCTITGVGNVKQVSFGWKTATEGAEVTRSGRLFQTRAAATGSRVRLTINDEDELERSR